MRPTGLGSGSTAATARLLRIERRAIRGVPFIILVTKEVNVRGKGLQSKITVRQDEDRDKNGNKNEREINKRRTGKLLSYSDSAVVTCQAVTC